MHRLIAKRTVILGLALASLLWSLAPFEAQTQTETGFIELEVEFFSDVQLAGTLTLPQPLERPVPAVLFVHGSGPVDRDENTRGFRGNIFNTLAHQLARHGIASLRYDKRGVGRSRGIFRKASFTDLVNDAKAAIRSLRTRPEVDGAKIFAVGHSEGGYIVPILAAEGFTPGGIVSLAGPVRPMDEVLLWQTEAIMRRAGARPKQIQAQLDFLRAFIDFVKQSQGSWEDYTLEELQQFMPGLTREQLEALKVFSLSWWREHFTRNPAEVLRRVQTPVLIIQGDKDLQVPWTEALLWFEELSRDGTPDVQVHDGHNILAVSCNDHVDVTVHVLADLNHVLRRDVGPPDLPPYYQLAYPIDSRVISLLNSWFIGVIQGRRCPQFLEQRGPILNP